MASFDTRKVQVYLKDGNTKIFIAAVTRGKAFLVCPDMRRQIETGGFQEMADRNGVFFSTPEVDRHSLTRYCEFINHFDLEATCGSHIPTLETVGSEEFPEVIKFYEAGYAMMLPRGIKGEVIRAEIKKYLQMAPLTLNELIMVHECTSFDEGILATALNNFANFKLPAHPPPEAAIINEYIKFAGLSNKLSDIESHILASRERARAEKAVKAMANAKAKTKAQPKARGEAARNSTASSYASRTA